ncbi:MAG TPA: hypothetical protein PK566_16240 [Pseudobacteroides sp.]|nr:hypothetical protein [Pseudobacteroides sp.]
MARGKSGRIVLEVDPNIKRKLYLALEQNQITLKDWFLETANIYISDNTTSLINKHDLVAEKSNNKYLIERVKK